MKSKIELSEKQESVVFSQSEAIYVKASAGSGKTRVLTERVRHLLTKTDKKILALTFTNKAGEEIKERLSGIKDITNKTFVGTFHSFCQTILENRIHLLGYEDMPHIFENENDRLELIEKSIQQIPSYSTLYNNQSTKEQKSFRYKALNFISEMKRQLISDIKKHTDDANTILLYREYHDILRNQNAIDYDDLLLLTHQIFSEFPKIASLYRRSFYAICVDEAQDLNNAQYHILKDLTNGELKRVMMVGDPNQAIYHFNGSSPSYMDIEFIKDFNPEIIALTENYRSSKAVLEVANKLIPNSESIEGIAKDGIFKFTKIPDEHREADFVLNKIQEFIKLQNHNDIEGDITYEKIVVLARNKYLFKPLEELLIKSNLTYYYKMSPGSLMFESKTMQIFDLALKIKLNPQDTLHLNKLLTFLSIKRNQANSISDIINFLQDNEQKQIMRLVESIDENGSNLIKNIEEYKGQILGIDDEEKIMIFNDIEELLKHWHIYAKSTDNKSLHQFKNAMALGKTNPLSEHKGITLSTVHTMKGQEFDIVFIIGMDDETFPDYRAVRAGGVDLTQEKNNLYVAFTRAKRWLYVTYPAQRTMPWGGVKNRKVSRFLKSFTCEGIKNDKE